MVNLYSNVDGELERRRKNGDSLQQLQDYFHTQEDGLDSILILNHCVKIAYECGLPYTRKQILKVFNKLYIPITKDFILFEKKKYPVQGSKAECLQFLFKFAGRKLISFKVEKVGHIPHSKPVLPLVKPQQIAPLRAYNNKVMAQGGRI